MRFTASNRPAAKRPQQEAAARQLSGAALAGGGLVPEGRWAINDDAYVLLPKEAWEERIVLEWARTQLEPQLRRITTSNSDNATLSKEYTSSASLYVPPIAYQQYVGTLSSSLLQQATVLGAAAAGLDELGRKPIASDDGGES